MSEFIRVKISLDKCVGINKCGKCVQVCPMDIFSGEKDQPFIVEQNEDECTLCELCLKECKPNAIAILKLYEN